MVTRWIRDIAIAIGVIVASVLAALALRRVPPVQAPSGRVPSVGEILVDAGRASRALADAHARAAREVADAAGEIDDCSGGDVADALNSLAGTGGGPKTGRGSAS